ncbi:MAG: hypothetical protein GY937_26150 [bacterium]|nr:hypothetical protein [bacterium]
MSDRQQKRDAKDDGRKASESKRREAFVEPRLTFVRPKLIKRGDARQVTAGFFGTFYP